MCGTPALTHARSSHCYKSPKLLSCPLVRVLRPTRAIVHHPLLHQWLKDIKSTSLRLNLSYSVLSTHCKMFRFLIILSAFLLSLFVTISLPTFVPLHIARLEFKGGDREGEFKGVKTIKVRGIFVTS